MYEALQNYLLSDQGSSQPGLHTSGTLGPTFKTDLPIHQELLIFQIHWFSGKELTVQILPLTFSSTMARMAFIC